MWFVSLFKWTMLLSSIVSVILAFHVYRKRKTSRPLEYFSGLMFANMIYAISYFCEIHMPGLAGAVFCLNMEYLGLSFIPVFWVLIAWSYIPQDLEKNRKTEERLRYLLVIPVIIIILAWTNPLHHLIYRDITLRTGIPLTAILVDRAPGFWIVNGSLIGLYVTGTLRMIYNIFYTEGTFRGQFALLLGAALLPSAAHILLLLQKIPYNLDIVPITFAISGFLLFWGMIRMQLFDFIPVARNMVLNAMEDAVFVLDTKNRLVENNQSAGELFLNDSPGTYGLPLEIVNPELWKKLAKISETEEISLSVHHMERIFKASKSVITHHLYGTLGFLYILHDITEIQSYVKKLEKLASIDGLTNLFNRRHFIKLASYEVSRVERYNGYFSMIIFDLDHFKKINDKYSHNAGDITLQTVGRLIRENTRSGDLYARYGGEEFILLYRETTPDQAAISVERLRKAIEQTPIPYEGRTIHVTASFGISYFQPNIGLTIDTCLHQADVAMYEAKKGGRNRYCHYKPDTTAG